MSIFLTCTGYSGPSYSCPSAYKNDTNNFFSVIGQGGMTLVPPATFPEVIVWEYPGPTGVTGSGGVGGAISIAGQSSFIGTTYAPLASVMLSGGGAGNGGMIVVGTLNVAGGGCGGCLAPFGTIPGFGPATGICPTFDIEAQATSIVAIQYARALIQTGQCLSNPTLGLVNFSYQFGTPP
ncbi:MAG: hypothetical protein E6I33_11295 [Chloroflexi bacterium]|nr:MAG: hypothetical protein E6I33_11295 [Chloroflexota bacterium]